MTVALGSSFEVELGSGASTGYMWELLEPHEHFRLISSRFRESAGATVGDSGSQVFELQAQEKGNLQLRFVRKRRWEQQAIDSQLIELNVI
jgi:predicted secreted protein